MIYPSKKINLKKLFVATLLWVLGFFVLIVFWSSDTLEMIGSTTESSIFSFPFSISNKWIWIYSNYLFEL